MKKGDLLRPLRKPYLGYLIGLVSVVGSLSGCAPRRLTPPAALALTPRAPGKAGELNVQKADRPTKVGTFPTPGSRLSR